MQHHHHGHDDAAPPPAGIDAPPPAVAVPADGRRYRVLLTKIGFDGHDRGSRIVAAYLRDAGMEVIYTGPWQSIPTVVNMAVEEDVDVIGISSLATDHLLVPRLVAELRVAGAGHVAVVVGGIVPENEAAMLQESGVAAVFHTGASRAEIVHGIAQLAAASRAALA